MRSNTLCVMYLVVPTVPGMLNVHLGLVPLKVGPDTRYRWLTWDVSVGIISESPEGPSGNIRRRGWGAWPLPGILGEASLTWLLLKQVPL